MTHQQLTTYENIVGKWEIARNEQFLIFPTMFSTQSKILSPFVHIFDIISLFADEFEKRKIGISGKGLIVYFFRLIIPYISMGECNTILSAYTKYRHLG